MNKFKIYIAHPISGLTGKEVINYYQKITELLEDKYYILSPMAGKEHLYNDNICVPHGYQDAICNNHAIFKRDMWMINQSDIIFCDFTKAKQISIGCTGEICVGAALNKHIVLAMEDDNIHNHAFILEAAHIILPTYDEAIDYLLQL